jgi:hypothetical protein
MIPVGSRRGSMPPIGLESWRCSRLPSHLFADLVGMRPSWAKDGADNTGNPILDRCFDQTRRHASLIVESRNQSPSELVGA